MRRAFLRLAWMGLAGGMAVGCAFAGGVDGEAPGDRFGWAVAPAGDVDRDGVGDLVVSAPEHEAARDGGKVYVYSAATGLPILSWRGTSSHSSFGHTVAGNGDLNADGVPDVLVSSREQHGTVRGFSGATGSVLFSQSGAGPGTDFGVGLAFAGDATGDGRTDVYVGDPDAPLAGRGRVYLYSATGSLVRTRDGENDFDWFGQSIANAGDVNADGIEEVIVGAPGFPGSTPTATGKAYLLDGRTGAILRTWTGTVAGGGFGQTVSAGADLDRDGVGDLLVGSVSWQTKGRVTAISGRTGAPLWTRDAEPAGSLFGMALAFLGDFNGDGFGDVAVGDPGHNGGAGRISVLSGKEGRVIRAWDGAAGARLGQSAAGLGDVNRDGLPDTAGGAPGHDGPAGSDSGRVEGFFGFRQPGTAR